MGQASRGTRCSRLNGAAKLVVAFRAIMPFITAVEGLDTLLARNGVHPGQRFPKVQSSLEFRGVPEAAFDNKLQRHL